MGDRSEKKSSEIIDFYKNSTIFITGGTGFLGKLFIEKILRVCPDIKRIYMLVRPKSNKDVNIRFKELFEVPNFGPLKNIFPDFVTKVCLIAGDCALPDLGLTEEDKKKLISEVDCVIHSAATVRFNEKLRTATYINVRAVEDLLKICKKMKHLKSILHVSTAYSNCVRKDIEEVFYEPPMKKEKLFKLLEALTDEQIKKMLPHILGDYPNTYVFTKSIAEDIIKNEAEDLPIAILRPSMILPTFKEPLPGWIDNFNGPIGVLAAIATGILHHIEANRSNYTDLVPADFVVNAGLVLLWHRTKQSSNQIPIYNYVSSPANPLTWGDFNSMCRKHVARYPTIHQAWDVYTEYFRTKFWFEIASFLDHTIPAYIVQYGSAIAGKKIDAVKHLNKMKKHMNGASYFALREWNFSNENVQNLWKNLSITDRELFSFGVQDLDWNSEVLSAVKGVRLYLLNDPDETLPEALKKARRLKMYRYVLLAVVFLLFCFIMSPILSKLL